MRGTTRSESAGSASRAWESWLGVIAVVLGVLLAAAHGTEWTKQAVIANATPASGQLPAAECPEDELVEEGMSVAECEQLVSEIRSFIASAPSWFAGFQTALAAIGTLLALASIVVGAALADHRPFGSAAAIPLFGALALVDAAGFVGAANTGPILRGLYLWNFLLWFVVHLLMTAGAVAGRNSLAHGPAHAVNAPGA